MSKFITPKRMTITISSDISKDEAERHLSPEKIEELKENGKVVLEKSKGYEVAITHTSLLSEILND